MRLVPRASREGRLVIGCALGLAAINAVAALALVPSPRLNYLGREIADSRLAPVIAGGIWAALVAALLVPLAWGVLRRRRGAWAGLLALLAVVLVVDLVHEEPPNEMIVPLVGMAGLLFARHRLVAEPYREALRRQMVPSAEAVTRTAALLEAYGTDSLAPFKLRQDVGHLFSEAGDAVLVFRVENRALLVAGDPIGSQAGVINVLRRARNLAHGAGLRFGITSGSPELAELMRETFGMRALYIGCEAIVDVPGFTLEGHKIKKVRQAYRRVQREGYDLECVRLCDLTPADHEALRHCQDAARAPEEEQSFAMAPESLETAGLDHSVLVFARHRQSGRIAGLMLFMPLGQRSLWSLALQLRDPGSPNGVIDALIVHALLQAQAEGIQELSLNFAAARRYLHEPVVGFWPHVARPLAKLAMRWTQIDALRFHNEKFSPKWEQRFVIIDHPLELPHVLFAIIWQEGQLPRPNAFLRPAWPQHPSVALS